MILNTSYRAWARAVCERLGLDPAETSDIVVHLDPGGLRVEWSGRRRVDPEVLGDLLRVSAVEATATSGSES